MVSFGVGGDAARMGALRFQNTPEIRIATVVKRCERVIFPS